MGNGKTETLPMHFKTMMRTDLPQGRNGKHKLIITTILKDLARLETGSAIKVPLSELADSKANIRSALNRATRKSGRRVATSTDDEFLYVWNETVVS